MPARTAQAGLAAPQLRPAATAQPMQRRIGLFHSGLPHGSCSQIGTFCVSRSSPRYMTSPIRIRSDFLPERWKRLDGDRRQGPGSVREHSASHIDMHSGDTLFSRSYERVGTRPRRPPLTSFRSRAVVAATTSQRGCRRLAGDYARGGHRAAVVVRGGIAHGGGQRIPAATTLRQVIELGSVCAVAVSSRVSSKNASSSDAPCAASSNRVMSWADATPPIAAESRPVTTRAPSGQRSTSAAAPGQGVGQVGLLHGPDPDARRRRSG